MTLFVTKPIFSGPFVTDSVSWFPKVFENPYFAPNKVIPFR